MSETYQCKSPVLFLVFNRPDVTARVFEVIRQAKPPRLYIAADGPRPDREGEAEKCEEVRKIATAVDWDCDVEKLFRDENLGCGRAPSEAISWFFENEPYGIILEDDCLPDPSFFKYCEWALKTYSADRNVWHISGNNFLAPRRLFGGSAISFVALPQVWGWATWWDRWENYLYDACELSKIANKHSGEWQLRRKSKHYKFEHIESLKRGLDTWDYQWQIVVLNHRGLAVVPSVNLITNLGVGSDATHTRSVNDWRLNMPAGKWTYTGSPISPKLNKKLSVHFETNMGMPSITQRVAAKLKYFLKKQGKKRQR